MDRKEELHCGKFYFMWFSSNIHVFYNLWIRDIVLKDARKRTTIVFMRVASLYFVKHSLRHLRLGASDDKGPVPVAPPKKDETSLEEVGGELNLRCGIIFGGDISCLPTAKVFFFSQHLNPFCKIQKEDSINLQLKRRLTTNISTRFTALNTNDTN